MPKHYFVNSIEEFKFLKKKVLKILTKSESGTSLQTIRAKKQVKKFIKRMRKIEKYHSEMDWPHPEAKFEDTSSCTLISNNKSMISKPLLTNPDGSLYQKEKVLSSTGASNWSLNTDGSLFETPILPGSVLSNQFHSEEKIKNYLESSPTEE